MKASRNLKRYGIVFATGGSCLVLICLAVVMLGGCDVPPVPPYPWWGSCESEEGVTKAAEEWSDGLEKHIKDWLDGRASAEIPEHLIPEVQRNDEKFVGFRLVRPEEITADEQWIRRHSVTAIDVKDAYGEFWDPHVTYGLLNWMMVPFGSKVIMEGEFPHCRYFSLQVTHAFDPKAYRVAAWGAGEVALVDADIEPFPGHVNPFRVGANRNATKRGFRVEATATIGDPTRLDNAAWKQGAYRDPGNNHRHCSGISYTGPWGDPDWNPEGKGYKGDKKGRFTSGVIWLRMYGLDHAHRPQGGVNFPKVTYQLPDGRKYFIAVDYSKVQDRLNRQAALVEQEPVEMKNAGVGWVKQMSILRAIGNGFAQRHDPGGWLFSNEYLRDVYLGVEGRGEGQSGVRGLQPAATCSAHIDYLLRGMSLGEGKVVVVTGKMPTTPDTREGAPTMTAAEARYWSLTGYSINYKQNDPDWVPGLAEVSVMDDEVVKNEDSEYVLVLSRPQDRPANATAENGVTWVDWGPEAKLGFTLRWMTIKPEWSFAKSPTEPTVGYNSDIAAESYDPSIIRRNNRKGYLGEYQPVVGYLKKAEFEALGSAITPDKIPAY